jgi:hypothetical protein
MHASAYPTRRLASHGASQRRPVLRAPFCARSASALESSPCIPASAATVGRQCTLSALMTPVGRPREANVRATDGRGPAAAGRFRGSHGRRKRAAGSNNSASHPQGAAGGGDARRAVEPRGARDGAAWPPQRCDVRRLRVRPWQTPRRVARGRLRAAWPVAVQRVTRHLSYTVQRDTCQAIC